MLAGLAWLVDYQLTRQEHRNVEENQAKVQNRMRDMAMTMGEYQRAQSAPPQPVRSPSLQPVTFYDPRQQMEAKRAEAERVANEKRAQQEAASEKYAETPEYKMKELKAREMEQARLDKELAKKQAAEAVEESQKELDRTMRQKAMNDGVKDSSGRRYCAIPAGEFQMGSSQEEDPLVRMVVVEGFTIGQTEITYGEWIKTLVWAKAHGYEFANSAMGADDSHPVTNVSWFESVAWSNAKSEEEGLNPCYYLADKFGKTSVYRASGASDGSLELDRNANGYRLPTEAEWEKAARGGHVDHLYPNGNTLTQKDANFANEGGGTLPVMKYNPNRYGLYDMAGNVWEWCWTIHCVEDGSSEPIGRGIRGGGWDLSVEGCRVSFVASALPDTRSNDRGFRLVRRPREAAVQTAK